MVIYIRHHAPGIHTKPWTTYHFAIISQTFANSPSLLGQYDSHKGPLAELAGMILGSFVERRCCCRPWDRQLKSTAAEQRCGQCALLRDITVC